MTPFWMSLSSTCPAGFSDRRYWVEHGCEIRQEHVAPEYRLSSINEIIRRRLVLEIHGYSPTNAIRFGRVRSPFPSLLNQLIDFGLPPVIIRRGIVLVNVDLRIKKSTNLCVLGVVSFVECLLRADARRDCRVLTRMKT
jgi:hypothetical protein